MLSISKLRSSRADYYLATLPGAGRGLVEPEAYWLGAAALELGLGGAVQPGALRSVLAGRDPGSGRSLLEPQFASRRKLTGFDCTFSSPKSVSLLFALGPEDSAPAVRAAHDDAVAAALSYLERQATRVTLRGGGRRWGVDGGGIVAAVFPHRTSRAPDPHLHSHVLVANMVPLANGEWRALDARPWYAELRTAGALYETELRANLSRSLGVCFRQLNGRAWADIAGVERGWVEEFSRRRSAIRAALAESQLDVRATSLVAEAIRPPKDFATSFEQQRERWRERGYSVGLSPSFLARALDRPSLEVGGNSRAEESWATPTVAIALARSPDRSFSRGDLVRARCETAWQGLPVASAEKDVDDLLSGRVSGVEVVARGTSMAWAWQMPIGPVTRYSTREIVEKEQELVRLVEADPTRFAMVSYGQSTRIDAIESLLVSFGEARVVAVAPGVKAARAFESLTGITSVPSLGALSGQPQRIVLVDPHRLGPAELEAAIERRAAGRLPANVPPGHGAAATRPLETVMLVPQGALRRDAFLSQIAGVVSEVPISLRRQRTRAVQNVRVGDTRVLVADGPRAVLEAALAEARSPTGGPTGGRPAILVTGERAVARQLRAMDPSVRVIDPRQLAAKPPTPEERIVVVGGATELGLSQRFLDRLPRSHVLAGPADLPSEAHGLRALLGELVRPAHLCRAMGVPPHDHEARAVWRQGAAIVELKGASHELKGGLTLGLSTGVAGGLQPADRQRIAELRRACRELSLSGRARDLGRLSNERNGPGLGR